MTTDKELKRQRIEVDMANVPKYYIFPYPRLRELEPEVRAEFVKWMVEGKRRVPKIADVPDCDQDFFFGYQLLDFYLWRQFGDGPWNEPPEEKK